MCVSQCACWTFVCACDIFCWILSDSYYRLRSTFFFFFFVLFRITSTAMDAPSLLFSVLGGVLHIYIARAHTHTHTYICIERERERRYFVSHCLTNIQTSDGVSNSEECIFEQSHWIRLDDGWMDGWRKGRGGRDPRLRDRWYDERSRLIDLMEYRGNDAKERREEEWMNEWMGCSKRMDRSKGGVIKSVYLTNSPRRPRLPFYFILFYFVLFHFILFYMYIYIYELNEAKISAIKRSRLILVVVPCYSIGLGLKKTFWLFFSEKFIV